MTPLLKAESLSKTYHTEQQPIPAVVNVNLSVAAGEFLCIVGPSGCGKTTLLHLLGGLVTPTRGGVYLRGVPLIEPQPDIGIVFQKPNLMAWRSVLENVLLPLQVSGFPKAEAQQRALDALTLVGLSDFAHAYPKTLSGGMEQRVAVARALVQEPCLLLLDEPFSALDALTRERLNRELLRLWHVHQLSAIMVTHNIQEAVYLADRVLVLSNRPATIAAKFTIDLPRPRPEGIEYTQPFTQLAYAIRRAIQD